MSCPPCAAEKRVGVRRARATGVALARVLAAFEVPYGADHRVGDCRCIWRLCGSALRVGE
eukprot:scaffold78682_cov50-Phaeocystis_antarctica.AAC.2